MTDMQIRELAERHGWFGVEVWWSMAIPRFRAMLEDNAAQQSVERTPEQLDRLHEQLDEIIEVGTGGE